VTDVIKQAMKMPIPLILYAYEAWQLFEIMTSGFTRAISRDGRLHVCNISSTVRQIFKKRNADFVPFATNQNRALAFAVNGNTRARNFVLQFESSQQV
jgi:hypothetical protein